MSYGTSNVQGLTRKINEVMIESKNLKLDVAVITETKKKGQGSESMGQYDPFYSVSKDRRAQQGVSVLIKRNLRKHVHSWEAISERTIKINMTVRENRITIFGVYGINDDSLVNVKEKFFEDLNNEITKVGKTREIIILGDLNCRLGKSTDSQVVGPYRKDTKNNNGNRLITLWYVYIGALRRERAARAPSVVCALHLLF
ncbi:craniofacial development protein 2-like [Sitophilus oryzae]|uniref:Craniofacial development protein 2-like n=1 Tax=Sitophilus oryzae TaxID=7048 RepID=A0A6J2YWT0_SITOR|nr:craniofacial development protein 2-like [Sitophilus oryzae]